jgi:hypothetical protein
LRLFPAYEARGAVFVQLPLLLPEEGIGMAPGVTFTQFLEDAALFGGILKTRSAQGFVFVGLSQLGVCGVEASLKDRAVGFEVA